MAEPQSGPIYCFVGTVNLTRFDQHPPLGSVIGHLRTPVGVGVPFVQTNALSLGPSSLASVDQKVATLCGNLVFRDGLLALDVAYVSPGVHATTPGVSPLALTVLSLLGLLPAVD